MLTRSRLCSLILSLPLTALELSATTRTESQCVPADKDKKTCLTLSMEDQKAPLKGIILHFKVTPAEGMQLSFDQAPWQLNLTQAEGLMPEQTELILKDLSRTLPGFSVRAAMLPDRKPQSLHYKLISFACTQDKKQCFREIHEGQWVPR